MESSQKQKKLDTKKRRENVESRSSASPHGSCSFLNRNDIRKRREV